ncbi:MAG: hypothetical protein N2447_06710, partial [Thermoanaerobaculum sp.]|nr:hypothetical protein [Thermoanaerobaculum sp.]
VGLINASPGEVTVRLRFFRGDGVFLGEHSQALKPFEYTQLDRVLEKVMGEAVDNFYIVVSCTPEGARIFAYASVVDNRTGDPILVPLQKVLTQP